MGAGLVGAAGVAVQSLAERVIVLEQEAAIILYLATEEAIA